MAFFKLRSAALVLAAAGLFVASVAEARVGGGSSMGSRGTRTFQGAPSTNTAPKAAPIERSMTQPGAPSAAQSATRPNPGTAAAPSRFGGFGGLLMGGLIGAGLFGLLSGSGLFGGLTGFASFLGLLIQVALIGGGAWLLLNYFRNRRNPALARASAAGGTSGSPGDILNRYRQTLTGGGASSGEPVLTIGPKDYDDFERLLADIQSAYGREDTDKLGAMTTPEMFSYFSQDLADNARKGVRNETSGAKLLQGDLAESWTEAGSDYATVAMRYALVDAVVDRKSGRLISGNRDTPEEVTEIWTFRREHRDLAQGWQLSAIQQTADERAQRAS